MRRMRVITHHTSTPWSSSPTARARPRPARARRVDATGVPPIDVIASIDVSRVVSRRHRAPNAEDNAIVIIARETRSTRLSRSTASATLRWTSRRRRLR